jgi:lysozyme
MERPKLNLQDSLAIIEKSGYSIAEPVKVLAIRGYYLNSMGLPGQNDIGIYDDAMFLIGPNYFQSFNGNTDPARYRIGIATLVPGLHFFKKGKHGLSKPGGGYPAFRPDTPDESLPVTRYGQAGIFKGIAINIHQGGQYETSSEGCQTIIKDQWLSFQETAYKLMDKEGQRRLPYLLCENLGNGTYKYKP